MSGRRKRPRQSLGVRLIEYIRRAKLFSVECPAAPDAGCLIVWAANADDQLEAFIRDEFEADAKPKRGRKS